MFKNDMERKAFLDSYPTWPIWLTVPEIGMRLFRHDLPDGSYILVAEYLNSKKTTGWIGKPWGYPHYNLITQEDDAYYPSGVNAGIIINHLKNIKAEKGGAGRGK